MAIQVDRRGFLKATGIIGGAIAAQSAPFFLKEGLGARPIKWGMITPTTGPFSTESFDQLEGTRIAIDKVNRDGGVDGRQIQLLFRDDQFKWDQATTHALDLLDNHKVDFLAGAMVGPEEVRFNELSRKRKIIYGNYPQHIMSTPMTAKKMSPLFFTANVTPYQAAASAASYIADNKLGKKIHILADDYIWPKMFIPAWKSLSKKYGFNFDVQTSVSWVPFPTSMDYSVTFPKILKAKPEILYVINFGRRQVAFVKQAIEAGLHETMQIIIGVTDITMPEAAGPGTYSNMFASTTWHHSLENRYAGAKEFNKEFMKRRKRPSTAYGAQSYDLTRLILETARETGFYKRKDHFKLARALEGRKFAYTKGESWVRACDHVCVTQVFFFRGTKKDEMKGQFDTLRIVGESFGEKNTLPCKSKGIKGPASSRS